MRQACWITLVIAVAVAALGDPALAGQNFMAKLAIHIKAHGTSCTVGFPSFTHCTQINTTYPACGDIDIIPVFFELSAYTEVGMALDWTAQWGSMSWTRCKGDGQIGTLVHPQDYARVYWNTCQHTWSVALGYGWLRAIEPGYVGSSYLIHPRVMDCATPPNRDYACKSWSGVGYYGDDPCGISTATEPSTWGAIKAVFGD